jgi:NADPH2:quinone reductase
MRAAWYDRNGAAREVITTGELPAPQPAAGEVRVRIYASGVNPSDVKRRSGNLGQKVTVPRIVPHSDGAGVIDTVGDGVPKSRIGERVWLYNAQWQRALGTCAEFCCVPHALACPLPDGVDWAAGASLGIPAMTAHRAVFARGKVRGKTLLVTGGAGAVGHYAVQIAKWGGARVIATVSSPQKAALARAAGADDVLDYRADDVGQRVQEMTVGAGIDHIVEVDFGANLETSTKVLKPNGTIAAYASSREPEPRLPYYALMTRGIGIDLVYVYILPPDARSQALADLDAMLRAGFLQHNIGARFALEQTAAAHEAQESGAVAGNIVVDLTTGA